MPLKARRTARAKIWIVSETSAATPAAQTGQQHPARRGAAYDSAFMRATRHEPVPHTPVWFMRQAGRSLPEYLKVREGIAMLDSCMQPELVKEITLQPVRRHKVDAAIFFSDIVVPLKAVGIDVDIKPGVGPVIADPIRTMDDLQRLRPLGPDDMPYITEAVGMLVEELGATPLIGFAGAPFTLASYLVEGGPSKSHEKTKAMMYGQPELWAALVDRLADITAAFLKIQIEAGASAVQLFDSWVGALAPDDYRRSVMPASTKVFEAVAPYGVPRIHFGVGTGELLGLMSQAGADVVGVDWRVPLNVAAQRVGPGKALQGNLDPAVLYAPTRVVETKAREVLHAAQALGDSGHIFNLGHGVMPSMDPDALSRLVEFVHEVSAR
ncbi:uroporphyrinogen decarboxylase [Kitasatospora sp. MAP5-34]|nr:uroporphyrinogen decarboxylase [Kitasatospora sp. MAP5-34]